MATIYKLYAPIEGHSCDYGIDFTYGAGYTTDSDVAALYVAKGYTQVIDTYFSEYDKLPIATLQAMATEWGIAWNANTKKYTLVAALVTADQTAVGAGAIIELAKISDVSVETVPFGTVDDKAGVEAAMLVLANDAIGAGYTATLSGVSYVSPTWTGKFTVTSDTRPANTATDASNRSLTMIITANSAIAEMNKLDDSVIQTLPNATLNTKAGVEAAMITLAEDEIAEGFTVTINAGSTYNDVTKTWVGKLTVANDTLIPDTVTDSTNRSIVLKAGVTGATAELAKITDVAVKTVPNGTVNDKAGVEAAMLILAEAAIGAGYTASIVNPSTYDGGTNAWTGKFKVQNDAVPLDGKQDAEDRSFTVIIAEA